MEYNFSSLIDRLNNINFGENRRKGAFDLDNLPNEGFVIINPENGMDYIQRGRHIRDELNGVDVEYIKKYGHVRGGDIPQFHKVTRGGRFDNVKVFPTEKSAKEYMDSFTKFFHDGNGYWDKENSCYRDGHNIEVSQDIIDQVVKEIGDWKIKPIKEFKDTVYEYLGEKPSKEQGQEYVVCYFEKGKYEGTFTRFSPYPATDIHKNLSQSKVFNNIGDAKAFIKNKKLGSGWKATPYKEALALQKVMLEKEAADKIKAEKEKKAAHEKYLKSDAHKEELELAKKKREKQKEIREGIYKVTFYYSNSYLGSETFTVQAKSINDAFEKAKARAIARDPYCVYSGYDHKLRFNKNHIRFVEDK